MGRSILVCGSRTFTNWELMNCTLNEANQRSEVSRVIHGGAAGADRMGGRWGKLMALDVLEVLPQWGKYGISAGYKRNITMLDMLEMEMLDEVVAFWDGESRGTKHTIENANHRELEITVILYNPDGDEAEAWVKKGTQLKLDLGGPR